MKTTITFKQRGKHHLNFDEWFEKHWGKPPGATIATLKDERDKLRQAHETAEENLLHAAHYASQRIIAHAAWTARSKMRKDDPT